MLIVVSPAKALDFDSPLATKKHSQPIMLKKSKELVDILSTKTPDDLRSLMSISDSLAELNINILREVISYVMQRVVSILNVF